MGFLFCWLQIFDTLKSQADNLDDHAQVQGDPNWDSMRLIIKYLPAEVERRIIMVSSYKAAAKR